MAITVSTVERVRAQANAAHARYPQYAGHWDGPEWVEVEFRRRVVTKMGLAFVKGERTIARRNGDDRFDEYTAYSVRNACDTAVSTDWLIVHLGERDFAASVAKAKWEIVQDIADGLVPESVGSFMELHDHVDANEYGGLCSIYFDDGDVNMAFAARVQDAVHAWLKGGGHRQAP